MARIRQSMLCQDGYGDIPDSPSQGDSRETIRVPASQSVSQRFLRQTPSMLRADRTAGCAHVSPTTAISCPVTTWWRGPFSGGLASCVDRKGRLLFEIVEQLAASLAEWVKAAVDAHAVQLLETSAVELKDLEAWGHVPDVAEGDLGELAAPLGGQADSTAEGHDHVAAFLAAVEAFVGVGPNAVHGVGALGFSEDILEHDLKVVIDVVGVAVDEIDLTHDEAGLARLT